MRFFILFIFISFSCLLQAAETTNQATSQQKNDPACAAYALTVIPPELNCPEWKSKPLPQLLAVDDFKDPQKKVLAKRIVGYWTALIDARFETAYEFLSPAQQKLMSYKAFHEKYKQGQGLWKDIGFKSMDCKGVICDVLLVVNIEFAYMRLKIPIKNRSEIKEKWFFDEKNQQWYILLKI